MLYIFNTLKVKLFFSFFVFVLLTALVALTGIFFYQKRDKLGSVYEQLSKLIINVANIERLETNFFKYDVSDTLFYQIGDCQTLITHYKTLAETQSNLKTLKLLSEKNSLDVGNGIDSLNQNIDNYRNIFKKIIKLYKARGFTNFGLEGELHKFSEDLSSSNSSISKLNLLYLNRYENDYFIRKNIESVKKLDFLITQNLADLNKSPQSESVIITKDNLFGYYRSFQKLASIDEQIGYNYELGLKKELNTAFKKIESKLSSVDLNAQKKADLLIYSFKSVFISILILSVLIGIVLNYVLAIQLTKPITNLSKHINAIVESGFSGDIKALPVKGKDEVGRLTRNFNLMTSQIQNTLLDINKKSKVQQKQNMQLQSINLKLISSENKLKSLNSVKDKFFSIISHDLKGPLHTLTGFLQILIKYTSTFTEAELKEFAESMDISVKRLLTMLENLLQWSRSQTGSIEHKPQNINLKILLEENVNLFVETAKNKNISLVLETDNHVNVRADKNMLDFILRNLISNALKFTRSGGEVKISTMSNYEEFTQIIVHDNGIGISPEDMKKIFQPDIHFSTPGTGKEKGTGFGLLLCKDFVEKNGGEISIESLPGIGTNLKFTVPTVQELVEG